MEAIAWSYLNETSQTGRKHMMSKQSGDLRSRRRSVQRKKRLSMRLQGHIFVGRPVGRPTPAAAIGWTRKKFVTQRRSHTPEQEKGVVCAVEEVARSRRADRESRLSSQRRRHRRGLEARSEVSKRDNQQGCGVSACSHTSCAPSSLPSFPACPLVTGTAGKRLHTLRTVQPQSSSIACLQSWNNSQHCCSTSS